MLEKNKEYKKQFSKRVGIPNHLHLWLKKRAVDQGKFIHEIVTEALQLYKNTIEKNRD